MTLPQAMWDEVRRAYASAGRVYHGLAHLDAVLARYDEVTWAHPREALVALAYHDAVYVPCARDNEARSAMLAHEAVARWLPGVDPERVARAIELTARHGALDAADVDADEALLLDCDLAILGAPADVFDRYDADIAREYAALPAETYRAARRAFLERLLLREHLFLSRHFHEQLDSAARQNLARALARIGA
jgi:predicted metal-dependent HD superfamily phosphohydrolase